MRRLIPIIFSLLLGLPSIGSSQIIDTIGNTTIRIESLVEFGGTAYDWPWDLYWGPDEKLWFTVGDKICRYDTTSHLVDTLFKRTAQLCNTMSVVTHPDFVNFPYVYVTIDTANYYYSYSGGPIVLYRYTYSTIGDSL